MKREGLAKAGIWGWGKEETGESGHGESGNQEIRESGIREAGNRGGQRVMRDLQSRGDKRMGRSGNGGIRESGNRGSGGSGEQRCRGAGCFTTNFGIDRRKGRGQRMRDLQSRGISGQAASGKGGAPRLGWAWSSSCCLPRLHFSRHLARWASFCSSVMAARRLW